MLSAESPRFVIVEYRENFPQGNPNLDSVAEKIGKQITDSKFHRYEPRLVVGDFNSGGVHIWLVRNIVVVSRSGALSYILQIAARQEPPPEFYELKGMLLISAVRALRIKYKGEHTLWDQTMEQLRGRLPRPAVEVLINGR